jgi:hypothetical protein
MLEMVKGMAVSYPCLSDGEGVPSIVVSNKQSLSRDCLLSSLSRQVYDERCCDDDMMRNPSFSICISKIGVGYPFFTQFSKIGGV